MTSEQRAHEMVTAILDMCSVKIDERRLQLEAFVAGHLEEVERRAAEKAVGVYREKATEATDKVLSQTAIGAPINSE